MHAQMTALCLVLTLVVSPTFARVGKEPELYKSLQLDLVSGRTWYEIASSKNVRVSPKYNPGSC